MRMDGAAVLVTGGSRGLGAALGRELARRGARVVLVARGKAELDAVVEGIRRQGGEAHGLVEDVGDPASAARLAGAAAALVGPLDVLVHNASTLGPVPLRALIDTTTDEVERALQVNLLGPFRLTRAVAGSMALRGGGVVVLITSDAAVNAYPDWGAYGLSKAALEHMGRIWAAELAEAAVRFVTLDPGEMDTRMHADAMPESDRAALADPAQVAARIAALLEDAERLGNGARIDVAAAAPVAAEALS